MTSFESTCKRPMWFLAFALTAVLVGCGSSDDEVAADGTRVPPVVPPVVVVDAAGAVTLTGSATDVWVFQIAGDMTMNPGSTVTLAGGALPQNIFWRTAGVAALDTTAHLEGIVLSGSSVTLANGASVNGRLYATTAVTLIANTVRRPGS